MKSPTEKYKGKIKRETGEEKEVFRRSFKEESKKYLFPISSSTFFIFLLSYLFLLLYIQVLFYFFKPLKISIFLCFLF